VEAIDDDAQYCNGLHHEMIPLPLNQDPYFKPMQSYGPYSKDYSRIFLENVFKMSQLSLLAFYLVYGSIKV